MNKKQAQELAFQTVWNAAMNAANKAGDEWMAKAMNRGPAYAVMDGSRCVGTMLDVCGFVHLELRDGRSAFARWVKQNHGGCVPRWPEFRHKYDSRQEMGLKEACIHAAIEVFRNAGINEFRLYSRID